MDYCNSLLFGLPNVTLKKVQSVLNRAARLIFNLPPRVPTTPSLIELHWLPLKARIKVKICLIAFKALKFNQPSYIKELSSFSSHKATSGLQSENDPYCLHEPKTIGEGGICQSLLFLHCPIFNKLSVTIHQIDSLNTFKSHLMAFFSPCLWSVRSSSSRRLLCLFTSGVPFYGVRRYHLLKDLGFANWRPLPQVDG